MRNKYLFIWGIGNWEWARVLELVFYFLNFYNPFRVAIRNALSVGTLSVLSWQSFSVYKTDTLRVHIWSDSSLGCAKQELLRHYYLVTHILTLGRSSHFKSFYLRMPKTRTGIFNLGSLCQWLAVSLLLGR